jgi:hypothetical protein
MRFATIASSFLFSLFVGAAGCNSSDDSLSTTTSSVGSGDFDAISVPPSRCAGGWNVTWVPHTGSDPQFAAAADGTLHMLYIGFGNGQAQLRHVSQHNPAAATTLGGLVLGSLAVAPDGNARAFVADSDSPAASADDAGIMRLTQTASGWVRDAQPISGDGGVRNASAIDAAGHTHLAFGDGGLVYLTDASGSWQRTTDFGVPAFSSVAVFRVIADGNGHPHIFFIANGSDGNPASYWASNSSGAWRVVQLPGGDLAVAVDGNGIPHAVGNASVDVLHHYVLGAAGWSDTTLDALGAVTIYDAAIDGGGSLHLLVQSKPFTISYASNAGGPWRTSQVVALDPGLPQVPLARIAVGSDGAPHVAWKGRVDQATFGFATQCDATLAN